MSTYLTDPWTIPVPVRPSTLTALKPEHSQYNIETDLGSIAAFGWATPARAADELLHADLQLNADANVPLRLGSGRAGFYRGKYLKGIGRTPLAANWCSDADAYHNSGHLLPSAALREYLVSCLFRALGIAHAIVPCEGLLFARLPRHAREYVRQAIPERARGHVSPIDVHFRAVSIKPARFARFSNMAWALAHHRMHPAYIGQTFVRFAAYLAGPAGDHADTSPAGIARALRLAVERGISNFAAYLRAGVYWGSFHNNFSLDGRFLDLEVPTIFGAPFWGVLSMEPNVGELSLGDPAAFIMGAELIDYARQVRLFIAWLLDRLRGFDQVYRRSDATVRLFLRRLRQAIACELGPEHVLFSEAALIEQVVSHATSALGLHEAEQALVRKIARAQYHHAFSARTIARERLALETVAYQPAPTEPGVQFHVSCPRFLAERVAVAFPVGELIRDELGRLEQERDLDRLLSAITSAEERIRRVAAVSRSIENQ